MECIYIFFFITCFPLPLDLFRAPLKFHFCNFLQHSFYLLCILTMFLYSFKHLLSYIKFWSEKNIMGKIKAKDSCKSEMILAWPLLLQITQLCLFLSHHIQSFLPFLIASLFSFVIQVSMYSNLLSSFHLSSFGLHNELSFLPLPFKFLASFFSCSETFWQKVDSTSLSHNSHCLSTTVQKLKGNPKSNPTSDNQLTETIQQGI